MSPDETDLDVEVPDGSEAPPELRRAFWALVFVLNAALLTLTFGSLMLIFGVRRDLGLVALGGGVLLLGSAYYRYRRTGERLL